MKNNIDKLKKFLEDEDRNTIIINQVSDEIGCFYEFVISEMSKSIGITIIKNTDIESLNKTADLFENRKSYIYHQTNLKKINEITNNNQKNILITDYKNFKKNLDKFVTINGYEFEKDSRYFFDKYLNIKDENLINYCIAHPYLTFSELSKYNVNKTGYTTDPMVNNLNNFILEIRKEVFRLKKSNLKMKEFFNVLKNEVKYKKLSFLTF